MNTTYLAHHGILGQKWGVRRYQNYDGTLINPKRIRSKVKGESDDDLSYTNKKDAKPYKGEDAKEMRADAMAINGGMAGRNYGFNRNTNCGFCAVSYEMRRRGMPVHAQEGDGAMDPAIFNAFKHGKNDIKTTAKRESLALHEGLSENEFIQMRDGILKDGKNSRGIITLCWKALERGEDNIGGHAISYEVKDGDFFVVDPQIGKMYKGNEAYQYLKHSNKIQYMRTDNKKLEPHAEQYFAESDTTKIETSISKRIADTSAWAATAGLIGMYGGLRISAFTGNPVPLAAGLIGAAATVPVATIAGAVSDHQTKKHKDALMEKYRKEGRNTYYSTGKLDKAAKDNLGKSKSVKSKIQSLKGSHSVSEIAKMLGMDPKTVKLYM